MQGIAITLITCLYMLTQAIYVTSVGDIVYLHSGFTRASNKIDDVDSTLSFILIGHEVGVCNGQKCLSMDVQVRNDSLIGVKIVLSQEIGVTAFSPQVVFVKDDIIYQLFTTVLAGIFFVCWIMAFLNFIGLNI